NGIIRAFLRTAVNDFMDSVHHIWCPLSSQEFQDLPDGAETTLTLIF
ncbi:cytochrome B562, partial [Klebsiella pneumoniae]